MDAELNILNKAIDKLADVFARRNWKYLDVPPGSPREKTFAWPGQTDEEIMICVHRGKNIRETFHRQDFFFFNFAYLGDYGALSYRFDNHITIKESECYVGQPYAGYALYSDNEEEIIIVGVLIQKETFFRTFLPVLSTDERLFRFFLGPQTNEFSDEYLHLKLDNDYSVRNLLNLMMIEYAGEGEHKQAVLRSMTLTLIMMLARQYKHASPQLDEGLPAKIVRYISEHIDTATLKTTAAHFGYHPNYLSGLLHKETGKTFAAILTQQKMDRAIALLKGTDLSVEEISAMLGYADASNFYKAFKNAFGMSPREFTV